MSGAYLPGDTRQRIQDLIKDNNITQAELANIIGLSESAFSRYLKGHTEMLGDGYIIKIAKHFRVSTDFLLGETDIPDRKNYDIEELGLSTESAKLLYTGKIDSGILNLLIENPKFTHLIRLLTIYKDETMLDGIRAANQNYTFLRSLLMGQARFHPEDAATAIDLAQKLSDLKAPPVSADIDAIRTVFMQIVADIKASAASESKMYQTATSEILEDFRKTLTRGEEGFDLKSLTVDDMVQAIMHYARQGDFPPETLSNLEETLTELFESAKVPGNDE